MKVIRPFGPSIAKVTIPEGLVNKLNEYLDSIISNDEKMKSQDYGNKLAGNVSQEFMLEKEFIFSSGLENFLSTNTREWIKQTIKTEINNFNIIESWIVRQFENEYNPLHIHTGASLSCVGYLGLPNGIEKEWEEDYKDHHPANGHIQFAHGTPSGYNTTNFMVKPQVGDFYVFPAELFHCVYPFKTKGERRSFSVNFSFIEVPKDKK